PQIAPQIDAEAVLARDPQVILSTDDTIADPRAQWLRWPQLAAVRHGTIYAMPSDTVARASPRLVQGVESVCGALDDARRRLEPRKSTPCAGGRLTGAGDATAPRCRSRGGP